MQGDFDSEWCDAMSELSTLLYRFGAEPHEVRGFSKFLREVALTHYKSDETDDESGS